MKNSWSFYPQGLKNFKIVFILGRNSEFDLSEEIEINDDLLILDFDESHFNLPFKDIGFLRFIKNSCSVVDYVFKGDDDILLVPQNLASEIEMLKNRPQKEAIGCFKENR